MRAMLEAPENIPDRRHWCLPFRGFSSRPTLGALIFRVQGLGFRGTL